jgi:hypothetical protein
MARLIEASYMHSGCVWRIPASGSDTLGSGADKVRLRGLVVAAPCWVVLAVALALMPRLRGYGTHQQLGLPACSFQARTGYPCPTCGLTTSLSSAARGDLAAALRAHPFGPVLLAGIVAIAAAGTAELVFATAVLPSLRISRWWAVAALAGLLVAWGIKIAAMHARGELPLR